MKTGQQNKSRQALLHLLYLPTVGCLILTYDL